MKILLLEYVYDVYAHHFDKALETAIGQWVQDTEEGQWVAKHFPRRNLVVEENDISHYDGTRVRVLLNADPSPTLTEYLLRFSKNA